MADPYIPFYPSDWLGGTRTLTAEETGVYITLIAMIYEREAPLDLPHDRLARLCGCTVKAFSKALDALIAERKIVIVNGGIWNDRAEKELQRRENRSEKARASAGERWGKTKQKQRNRDANAMRSECLDDANQNQNHIYTSTNVDVSHANETSQAVAAYNAAADQAGWPKVQRLTPQRSKQIRARLSECGGIEGWEVALRRAMDSDFICGRTAKPWAGFGFDWLTKAANFTKLMEGNYDNRGRDQSDPTLRAIFNAARSFEA